MLPHLIFDLDGTLVDGAPMFVEILNEMLAERGSERAVTVDQARPHLSYGGPALVSAMLADECGDLAVEVADFRGRYARQTTPKECLYEGVFDGLHELAAKGFTLAICSNKPQHLCEKVLCDVGLDSLFAAIVGSSPGRQAKPAPDLMKLTLARLGSSAGRAVLIGDSEVDHALAAATAVPFYFVSYGYASEDWDRSGIEPFDRFSDLVEAVVSQYVTGAPLRYVA